MVGTAAAMGTALPGAAAPDTVLTGRRGQKAQMSPDLHTGWPTCRRSTQAQVEGEVTRTIAAAVGVGALVEPEEESPSFLLRRPT